MSLTIDEDGFKATPMTFAGFAFMWTGVRSTYGVTQGKVCFQVKVSVYCLPTMQASLNNGDKCVISICQKVFHTVSHRKWTFSVWSTDVKCHFVRLGGYWLLSRSLLSCTLFVRQWILCCVYLFISRCRLCFVTVSWVWGGVSDP